MYTIVHYVVNNTSLPVIILNYAIGLCKSSNIIVNIDLLKNTTLYILLTIKKYHLVDRELGLIG